MELILRRDKTPISYLFQDLNDVIMSYKFSGVIILEGEDLGAKEVNERRPEDQDRGPMRLQFQATWAHLF